MEATTKLERFAADPTGRCLIGAGWIHFCARPDFFGVVLWGRPRREDAVALSRSLRVELGDGISPHISLVDARRVESVDGEAFEELNGYVRDHHAALARKVTRLALVRPEGMAGAVAAGFYAVLESPYPVEVFGDARAALAWLDPDAGDSVLGELDRAVDDLSHGSPLLGTLRTVLAERLGDAGLRDAARAMNLSERSLQRHLRAAGTTFQRELCAARIREAKRRMLDSDAPLTRIALDVGFTSLQQFSRQFRRLCGEPPTAWRTRRRS